MKERLCLETLTEFLRLRTSLERILTPVTAKYGLTPMQATLLHLIAQSDNATVGSIFRELDLNQGNVSTLCKKLESEGFIKRSKNPDDERIILMTLTEQGRDALNGIESVLPGLLPKCAERDIEEGRCAVEGLEALKNIAMKINSEINSQTENNNA